MNTNIPYMKRVGPHIGSITGDLDQASLFKLRTLDRIINPTYDSQTELDHSKLIEEITQWILKLDPKVQYNRVSTAISEVHEKMLKDSIIVRLYQSTKEKEINFNQTGVNNRKGIWLICGRDQVKFPQLNPQDFGSEEWGSRQVGIKRRSQYIEILKKSPAFDSYWKSQFYYPPKMVRGGNVETYSAQHSDFSKHGIVVYSGVKTVISRYIAQLDESEKEIWLEKLEANEILREQKDRSESKFKNRIDTTWNPLFDQANLKSEDGGKEEDDEDDDLEQMIDNEFITDNKEEIPDLENQDGQTQPDDESQTQESQQSSQSSQKRKKRQLRAKTEPVTPQDFPIDQVLPTIDSEGELITKIRFQPFKDGSTVKLCILPQIGSAVTILNHTTRLKLGFVVVSFFRNQHNRVVSAKIMPAQSIDDGKRFKITSDEVFQLRVTQEKRNWIVVDSDQFSDDDSVIWGVGLVNKRPDDIVFEMDMTGFLVGDDAPDVNLDNFSLKVLKDAIEKAFPTTKQLSDEWLKGSARTEFEKENPDYTNHTTLQFATMLVNLSDMNDNTLKITTDLQIHCRFRFDDNSEQGIDIDSNLREILVQGWVLNSFKKLVKPNTMFLIKDRYNKSHKITFSFA